ncbi:MAG: hypothetical protein VCC99_11935 [Alphaproteobacteria bacterium]
MTPDQGGSGAKGEIILSLRLSVAESAAAAAPGLAGACSKILSHRVARSGAELIGDNEPDLLTGLELRFTDPIAAVACVLRYLADIEKMRGGGRPIPTTGRRFLHRFGIAQGDSGRARALRDAVAGDAIGTTGEIWAAIDGKLDVEARTVDREADTVILVATKIGKTFRYMPWTTPGRRRVGLILAALLIGAMVIGMKLFGLPPK